MKGDEHLRRVRRICLALTGVTEKLSHGAPAFFANKKTFAMFVDNHHRDGHIAVWVAAAPGEQAELIHASPEKYFMPPYVGYRGWVGVELSEVDDDELGFRLTEAWRLIAPRKRSS
jgi:hypothetical protein